ncbi:hypothetical protein CK203_014871 [Vitis vinifera]|uniref:Retrotransposon gag domain-containing protein n=1 Tax=Vitis vinifera TaxID=29760 RepID=A0A438JGL9_VITVI|nr:hypothetical protein CK203_014871 [Vitis vinifera]
MATPSQSRSSGREEEDNHEWRQAIEKRQLASEKQLKALLQETERLREENAVLRIQASTSGPPRRQRSKGQVANSKPEPESIYPGSTGAIPGTYNARPHEPRTPMPRAPREESSDSTHFSAKRQRDRKSQLSSSMRARLGPQEPGRSRPPAATTRAPRPDPMIAPIVQNVPPHRDPMVTLAMRNVHSHLAERPAGRNLPNEPPIGSISKRLDDMLSTPFCSHITHYEPPRGFLVPKFSTYDGTNDPFDHIMHYRQLMTLDIGNDALLCKVFPASLQGQALSWFHRLPPNSIDNFRDLSEAFVGQYLCSARHKQNISTLQNIKMRDNESLREFVKRFGQAVLQIEPLNKFWLPDGLLEITRTGMPSLQTVQNQFDRRQDGPSRPNRPPATPLSVSYEKLLPMIQGLSDFRWPRPLETDPSRRDRSKKCAFHKDHGHTTETCRSLQYLVERLIKAGHLKQYLRSDTGGRDVSQHHNSEAPRAPVAPKAVINYINGGPSDEEYDSRRKRQKLLRAASIRERINSIRPGLTGEGPRPIDGTIIFPPVDPTRTLQPHRDALILSLEIGDFDVRRILVDPGSSADLVQASVIGHMGHSLAVTLNVQFSVVQELSPFNIILGRTWLHYMKAIPSTYHQMVSFLTNEGQTDLYGSQLAARQCYQIAREAVANQEDASPPEPSIARDQ